MSRIGVILLLFGAIVPGAVVAQAFDAREGKRLTTAARNQGRSALRPLAGGHRRIRRARRAQQTRARTATHDALPLGERREGDDARVGPAARGQATPERNGAPAADADDHQVRQCRRERDLCRDRAPRPAQGRARGRHEEVHPREPLGPVADHGRRPGPLVSAHRQADSARSQALCAQAVVLDHEGATLGHRAGGAPQEPESLLQGRLGPGHHPPGRPPGAQTRPPTDRAGRSHRNSPSMAYGEKTIEGIAARLLRR